LLLSNIAAEATIHKPELINKIGENAREAIERIREIIWTTNPKYDEGENLRPKIINYIAPLCQMHNIHTDINISEAIKNIKFSMEMRKNIFLIIKEALNNILKHSGATVITFNLFLKEKMLVFEITDNGKGFDRNDSNNGNGLKTMVSRTESMGGTLLFDTVTGGGTKIMVTLPLSRVSYLQ
jgi:signal transduction histidine kinase